jgi:hypothetical protein
MKKLLLTSIAALFLATGTAHAEPNASMLDLSMHRGDNPVFLFLEKDNGQKYFGFFSIQENCADILTLLERRRDAGMETWLTLRAGKPERVLNVMSSVSTNNVRPTSQGKPKPEKTC